MAVKGEERTKKKRRPFNVRVGNWDVAYPVKIRGPTQHKAHDRRKERESA